MSMQGTLSLTFIRRDMHELSYSEVNLSFPDLGLLRRRSCGVNPFNLSSTEWQLPSVRQLLPCRERPLSLEIDRSRGVLAALC